MTKTEARTSRRINTEKYWLSPRDQHPNALADLLIASCVVAIILSPQSGQ